MNGLAEKSVERGPSAKQAIKEKSREVLKHTLTI